jgi:putative ABC transport system permease protein
VLRERGVFLRSLTEGLDTSTASGRLLHHVLGAVAECEREVIKERTVAGMKAPKKRGTYVGRAQTLVGSRLAEVGRMLAAGSRKSGGVAPSFTYIRTWATASGTIFTQRDVDASAKVAVLGQTVVQNLFPGGADPIGQTVLVRNVPFVVYGTLSPKGQTGIGQDQDDTILIPYTSALQRLTGQTTLASMEAAATGGDDVAAVQTEVTQLLDHRHRRANQTTFWCGTCKTSRTPPPQPPP